MPIGPWLVVAGLALVPPALAAAPVCAGRDLAGDPAIKPDYAAHADELLNADGLFWRVEKSGLAPSFFYGTMHSTNADAVALARKAAESMAGASSVATELGGPMDSATKIDLSAGMVKAALATGVDTLAAELAPEDIASVDAYLAARGLPKEMSHHLKLWFIVAAASLPACETAGEQLGLPEVDEAIAEAGKARGLPVIALETVDEQIQALANTPASLAASLLKASARVPALNDDAYVTLLNLYLHSRPAFAIPILDAIPQLTPAERAAQTEFTRELLAKRNGVMMTRAAPLLEKGGAFVAVGALHLSGKDGLIERARAAGYQVTKIW